MAEPDSGERPNARSAARTDRAHAQRISYLDNALWKQLAEARASDDFARYWLALQCRMVSGVVRAHVALGSPDTGPFTPVACWPDGDRGSDGLNTSAQRALAERRGVIYGHRAGSADPEGSCFAAYPFIIEDRLHGVIALEISDRTEEGLRAAMRQLQWGSVWIELLHRRQSAEQEEAYRSRAALTLDLVAGVVEEEAFEAASIGAVTQLATHLECGRVSLGFLERGCARVAAVSHTARFGKRTNLIRAIGAAMDEAIDQKSAVMYPVPGNEPFVVTAAHADLSEIQESKAILTIPFGDKDRFLGAFTFEWSTERAEGQTDIEALDVVASVAGPILAAKRRESRWLVVKAGDSLRTQLQRLLGPRHYGRKLAAAVAVVFVILAAVVHDMYRVTATASLEGLVRRAVVAPFDGYILSERARAGDKVSRGEELATLDIHDLALERLRRISTRSQRLAEYNQALAERRAAEVNVIKARIDQVDAEIALFDEQIARARLRAPFDGLVLSGDLSQSVGSSVSRGDVLFEIGPLDAYRVILKVDDRQIRDIEVGQQGDVLLSSLPETPLPITVTAMTPVSEAREGRNVFRVEARLDRPTVRLRPGMEGVAKIEIGERRLVWIWASPFIDWIRVKLWSWVP